jgi:50S ribosomal protein L16 3-hydroxylase
MLPNSAQFLRHHWHTKPLLIRQAFPDFKPLLDAEALIALTSQDDVESRLIRGHGARWQLEHGPFEPGDLPSLKKKHWTLLVQGLDLHLDAAHHLLKQFRFIPDARLDDLMVSLASDGGGVGPHYDSYDVFLLQAWGRREWRIGPLIDRSLRPNCPVKLLNNFIPQETMTLEPGDMLYLPPHWGHDGIAQGPCMTYSIGFRSPSKGEFLEAFYNDRSDAVGEQEGAHQDVYEDAGVRYGGNPAQIPERLNRHLRAWIQQDRPTQVEMDGFIGRFLSEPKDNVWFPTPQPRLSATQFLARASRRGLALQRASRMLIRADGPHSGLVFCNGQADAFSGKSWRLVSEFAENRSIVVQAQLLEPQIGVYLYQLYTNGWIVLL